MSAGLVRPLAFALVLLLAAAATSRAQVHSAAAARAPLVVFQPQRADVRVMGWDRDSVQVTIENAGGVRIAIESVGGAGTLQILERRPPGNVSKPRYLILAPRASALRVTTQEGTLQFRGLSGSLRGAVTDGSISADSIAGNVELSSVTGAVDLRDSRGDLEARSVAGNVSLRNVAGTVRVRTTSGDVHVALAARSPVTIESYSGRILVAGSLGGGSSSLATHSGEIVLEFPQRGDVTLLVARGRVEMSAACAAVPARPAMGRPTILGSGGDAVDVMTFSGGVTVHCGR